MLLLWFSCGRVPVTGRRQFDIVPTSQILQLAGNEYSQFLSQNKVVEGTAESRMLKEVGNNIAGAVEQFLRENGMEDEIQNFKWEFNLIESKEVNAWAMPGGKIAFYTGILPVTQNAQGLAVVMGHEVAHAVANHGGERMSHALTAQLGGMALDLALRNRPQETRNLFLTAYGVGATVGVLLPYSRLQESEADRIGLIFMAKAGYDPMEAISFWQRMANVGGQQPPEFLSTHPGHETRISNLKKFMPEAMEHYRRAIAAGEASSTAK